MFILDLFAFLPGRRHNLTDLSNHNYRIASGTFSIDII
jgi:hypothetical protein